MAEKSTKASKAEAAKEKERDAENGDKHDRGEKAKALELAIGAIEKHFGKGAIMRLGDHSRMRCAVIPTGALSLDVALGIGGIPRGRITEIFGPEAGGKTTFALHVVAEAQKLGGTAAFIDAEHALDPDYAGRIGVDVNNLLVSQPDDGEQALDICDTLVRSNAVDIIVIDSVAALVPRAEIEGEMSDLQVGLQARLMSKGLRKLAGIAGRSKTAIIFINQLREKIGISYGNPEVTTGGRALRFYSSVRLEVRRVEAIKRDTTEIGNRVRAKVVKNKMAPPFRQAEFDIIFGKGISTEGSILDMAAERGIVVKSGAWYSFNGQKIGQGRDNARDFLGNNQDILQEIEARVRENLDLTPADALSGGVEELEPAGVS